MTKDMADVSDKTANDVNNDTYKPYKISRRRANFTIILSTIEEQKVKKTGTCKNYIFKLCKENFSEDINDQNFSEHMNTLVKERKVNRKIFSKKESYLLVHTIECSDILNCKRGTTKPQAELSTFKDSVMADLLEYHGR